MAVVINDFEVIVAPPAASQSAAQESADAAPPPSGGAPPLSPADLAEVLTHLLRRSDRLRAD